MDLTRPLAKRFFCSLCQSQKTTTPMAYDLKMNDLAYQSSIISLCILFFLPSLWAKSRWSGDGYSGDRFLIAFIYNFIFSALNWQLVQTAEVPFSGTPASPLLQWFSIFMAVAHIISLPRESLPKRWFSRKASLPISFNPHYSYTLKSPITDFLSPLFSLLIPSICCATFYSGLICLALIEFIDVDIFYRKIIFGTLWIILFGIFLYGLHTERRKRGYL
ncbi:hypothetical protein K5D32_21260 [Pseudomonas cichorii]|nr:hypothetical protein [Pseudomonas cichorii]MBX8532203.1 hypothetical protein [Pseudomonas cichorii]